MALPNALGLVLSTMSVAHAFNDIFVMRALIYPSVEFNKKRDITAPPVETTPATLYKYGEGASKVHICVHAATIGCMIWSLKSLSATRDIISAALAFEIGSLAVAPLIISVTEKIYSAKTREGIEDGFRQLMRRQLLRNALLHVPCTLCCLSAVTGLGSALTGCCH